MPLEPADPGRPSRKLQREPGLSGLIPLLVAGAAIFLFVALMFMCSAGSQISSDDPVFEDEVVLDMDRQTSRLNATDALEQGGQSLERYRAEHGRYTTDFSVITEEGMWSEVTIEGVHADEDSYCMQASSGDVDRFWHLTEKMKRPRSGRCP